MGIIITIAVVLAFVYVTMAIAGAMVLGCSPLVAAGLKEGVFVSRDTALLYYKAANGLPTFPVMASRFSDLHEAPMTYEEALAMVPEADRNRHEARYSW